MRRHAEPAAHVILGFAEHGPELIGIAFIVLAALAGARRPQRGGIEAEGSHRAQGKREVSLDYAHERAAGADDGRVVAGIDEVGRGPLAGPVVAAAVILHPHAMPGALRERLADSKTLRPDARAEIAAALHETCTVALGEASVAEIDTWNILNASHLAMARALAALSPAPDFALVDGNRLPSLPCAGECVVGGDGCVLSIAAASIVAKVARDRRMAELDADHPGYGWARNMGYGTREHREALARLGATKHHRRSFRPVREALSP